MSEQGPMEREVIPPKTDAADTGAAENEVGQLMEESAAATSEIAETVEPAYVTGLRESLIQQLKNIRNLTRTLILAIVVAAVSVGVNIYQASSSKEDPEFIPPTSKEITQLMEYRNKKVEKLKEWIESELGSSESADVENMRLSRSPTALKIHKDAFHYLSPSYDISFSKPHSSIADDGTFVHHNARTTITVSTNTNDGSTRISRYIDNGADGVNIIGVEIMPDGNERPVPFAAGRFDSLLDDFLDLAKIGI